MAILADTGMSSPSYVTSCGELPPLSANEIMCRMCYDPYLVLVANLPFMLPLSVWQVYHVADPNDTNHPVFVSLAASRTKQEKVLPAKSCRATPDLAGAV